MLEWPAQVGNTAHLPQNHAAKRGNMDLGREEELLFPTSASRAGNILLDFFFYVVIFIYVHSQNNSKGFFKKPSIFSFQITPLQLCLSFYGSGLREKPTEKPPHWKVSCTFMRSGLHTTARDYVNPLQPMKLHRDTRLRVGHCTCGQRTSSAIKVPWESETSSFRWPPHPWRTVPPDWYTSLALKTLQHLASHHLAGICQLASLRHCPHRRPEPRGSPHTRQKPHHLYGQAETQMKICELGIKLLTK